jgi:predicted nucleic acid-binding protein
MDFYADSSFLVSCYIADANTASARTWLSRTSARLPFTALPALEVRNAFKLGVFRRLFGATDAAAAWANSKEDLRTGRLTKMAVKWPVVLRIAARLSERHTAATGARSLNILHVAIAKTVRAAEFVSFDTRQRALAAVAGLRAVP